MSILLKEQLTTIRRSKGRFLSISLLMALGSFALVGLKASGPDIDASLATIWHQVGGSDLTVIGDYGLSQADQEELEAFAPGQVELGYMTDTVVSDSPLSIRVFSKQETSPLLLKAGHLPQEAGQVVLSTNLMDQFQLGQSISLREEGDQALLKREDFTIVGWIESTDYLSNSALGLSQSGSGSLGGYAYVLDQDFDSPDYLLARFSLDQGLDANPFSPTYQEQVIALQKDLEAVLADNGAQRYQDLKETAQEDLDQAQKELDQAQSDLDQGQEKLDQAKETWQDKADDLEAKAQEVAQEKQKLDQGQISLDQAYDQLLSSQASLDQGKQSLDQGWLDYQNQKEVLDQAQAQLEAGRQSLEAKDQELAQAQSQLEAGQAQLQAGWLALSQGQAQADQLGGSLEEAKQLLVTDPEAAQQAGVSQESIQVLQAQWDQVQAQLEAEGARLLAGQKTLDDQAASLAQGQSQVQEAWQELQAQSDQLAAGQAQLDQGYQVLVQETQTYQAGLDQYQAGLAQWQSQQDQVNSGLAQIQSADQAIAQGREALAQAKSQLEDQEQTFLTQKEDALKEMAEGQEKIDQGREDLAKLSQPKYTVYTPSTALGGEGFEVLKATSEGISSVGNLFPLVLYGVAALVAMTTMTRFVGEERTNAGILKALGYREGAIVRKFLLYGFSSSFIGAIVGILAGTYLLPYLLAKTLLVDTILPGLTYQFYWPVSLLALALSLFCGMGPAWWIAHSELKEKTASLLQAKAPSSGSRILLERFDFLWKRLSFTQKVTARNIFRYKLRMYMTILGVGGSVALLVAGLGILSSLNGMSDRQFGAILQFDGLIVENKSATSQDLEALDQALKGPGVADRVSIDTASLTLSIPGLEQDQAVQVLVIPGDQFGGLIQLAPRSSKENLSLPKEGIFLSEKLAKLYHVKAGDPITLADKSGQTYHSQVAQVVEMYAGHYLFLSREALEKDFSNLDTRPAHLVKYQSQETQTVESLGASFMALTGVEAVLQNTQTIKRVDQLVASLTQVMLILVLVSILLALVILYNLNNINVAERIRELSTIKVLGFLNSEVTLYIYRETILLSLLGMVVGLLAGKLLHFAIIETVATDFMMFDPDLKLWVYLAPLVIISLILAVLGRLLARRLSKIDMLEALKSVE